MKEKQTWVSKDHHNDDLLFLLILGLVFMGFLLGFSYGEETEKTPIANNNNRTISAMFVMGDSSVDCGDNTLFYSRLHRNLSLIPCIASNRSLIPHLLAEKMALLPAVPFYSQTGSIEDLMKGLNFGSAQATIMNPGSQGYQSLNQQLRQVAETIQLLNLKLSQKMLLHFVRSSVFYVSFGKDDYINLIFPSNASSVPAAAKGLARVLASEMERAVRTLHDLKIRRIVCAGILPLGCTPRIMMALGLGSGNEPGQGPGSCSEMINEMVLEYNLMMEERIMELNADFPDARVVFCDVYQGIKEIVSEPQRYGFEEVKKACCGMGIYGAEIGCVSEEMACNNTEGHLWWDQYNPTKAVNTLLADSAWSGQPFSGLCRPINIQQLVSSSPPRIATLV